VLRALLNTAFHCHHCGHTHRPTHSALGRCATAFTHRLFGASPPTSSWSANVTPYQARMSWRAHNRLWTPDDQALYDRLITELAQLAFFSEGPVATPVELASPHGAEQLRARYHTWRAHACRTIDERQAAAAPLLAQLERLLPPPYPAGPPTGTLSRDSRLRPDPAAAEEIRRVRGLFTPPPRVVSSPRTIELRAAHFGILRRWRGTTDVIARLGATFHAEISTWTAYRGSTLVRFDPNRLGLDPAFWERVELYRGTLSLRTRRFQLLPHAP
jgi:hypothetical protein